MSDYKLRVKPLTTPKKTPESTQVRDSFETPRYAVELLLPFIPKSVRWWWECAAGNKRISKVLLASGLGVFSSDLIEKEGVRGINFLSEDCPETPQGIITNPPFSIKKEFIEKAFQYDIPFAFLINADYSGEQIGWIERGCEKIIPKRRINYLTPNIVARVNLEEGTKFTVVDEIPNKLLHGYSSSQFHSMWLTKGFNLGRTETFVDLPIEWIKEHIL